MNSAPTFSLSNTHNKRVGRIEHPAGTLDFEFDFVLLLRPPCELYIYNRYLQALKMFLLNAMNCNLPTFFSLGQTGAKAWS